MTIVSAILSCTHWRLLTENQQRIDETIHRSTRNDTEHRVEDIAQHRRSAPSEAGEPSERTTLMPMIFLAMLWPLRETIHHGQHQPYGEP